MKPTYGRVSRYGLIAFASSLDQIGPIARSVEDAAVFLNVLSGHDAVDSTSWPEPPPDFTEGIGKDIKGMRLGVPKEYFSEGLDPEVESSVRAAVDHMVSVCAEAVAISLPASRYAISTYYFCAYREAC